VGVWFCGSKAEAESELPPEPDEEEDEPSPEEELDALEALDDAPDGELLLPQAARTTATSNK